MPKFSMKDVDKQMEEIRARHRQPKSQVAGGGLLDKFREITAKRKAGPGAVVPPVTR